MLSRFAVLSLLFLSATFVGGRDIYVATNGAGPSPFGTWGEASANIEWAVNIGTNGDNVWISNGVYVLTNQITVRSNLFISGTGGVVVVDGNNAGRCFYLSGQFGTLANLTITRGYTNYGGGVYGYNQYGTIRDCIFSNNFATNGQGGGMFLTYYTVTVQRCTFVNNTANGPGGGLYVYYPSTTLIDHCFFQSNISQNGGGFMLENPSNTVVTGCDIICNVVTNTGGNGGGAYINSTAFIPNIFTHCTISSNICMNNAGGLRIDGNWIVSNCYFSNNIAAKDAGGIYMNSANAIIKNCLIARNIITNDTAANEGGGGMKVRGNGGVVQDCIIEENRVGSWGGGIYHYDEFVTVRNCLIRNNVASGTTTGAGGGIRTGGNGLTISGCTIVSNYARGSGGGGYAGGGLCNFYGIKVENSIIYGNAGGPGYTTYSNYYSSSTDASFSNCCFAPALATAYASNSANNITSDPQFVGNASGNYRLGKYSPCVNTGVNRPWMTDALDLDRHRRIDKFSGIVDMGCYEYIPKGTVYGVR